MPYFRTRFGTAIITKLAKLWPVVGLVGARQIGKTTLMQQIFDVDHVISLDDFAIRQEAVKSPKTFLEKLDQPVILDEVQKAPPLFDAIKLKVDKKRVPGSYFLTDSSAFSTKIDVGESLTGRIGLTELLPMTLAELNNKNFRSIINLEKPLKQNETPRFSSALLAKCAQAGGMPVPAFLRDKDQQALYWRSWLETTVYRDLARYFKRGYDPEFVFHLLERMGGLLREGELPTLKHFNQPSRKVRKYLEAMEEIFLIRKINPHPLAIGKEIWLLLDSGLAAYLMGTTLGENSTLSLVRHFIRNEIMAQAIYQGKRFSSSYYKSTQGSPIDFVINNIPFRIVSNAAAVINQLNWEERPLIGAMKKLNAAEAYLIAPIDKAIMPSKTNSIGILPWSSWS